MNDRALWAAAILATLAAGPPGCGRATGVAPPETPAAAPPAAPEPAISEEDAAGFANDLEREVAAGDPDAVAAKFDWDALLDTAMAGIPVAPDFRKGFIIGAKKSLVGEGGLTRQLVAAPKGGGGFKLLRVRTRGKRRAALFRLILPNDQGVDYLDCILSRRPDGSIRVVDMFTYTKSELSSQSIRRLYLPVAENSSRNLLQRLTQSEQDIVKNTPGMTRMLGEIRAGKNREALDTYNQFPPGMKKEKNFLFMRLQAAQVLGEKEHLEALEDFRAYHPDDPCTDLLSIDYFTFKKQYARARESLDRLDRAVGGDPYLDFLRGSLFLAEEDLDAAKAEVRKAIEREPTLKAAYWSLITITLNQHRFDETAAALTLMTKNLGITFNDLTAEPAYAEFVKSPEYRDWLASRRVAAAKAGTKGKAKRARPKTGRVAPARPTP